MRPGLSAGRVSPGDRPGGQKFSITLPCTITLNAEEESDSFRDVPYPTGR